jgi:hypothetical protein
VAKDLEFIAALFYLQKSITTRACCPEHVRSRQLMSAAGFPLVAAAQIFFHPYVWADKEISAADFSNRQLSFPCPVVAPSEWDSGP